MYCTECGQPAAGRYCAHCGALLTILPRTRRDDAAPQPVRPRTREDAPIAAVLVAELADVAADAAEASSSSRSAAWEGEVRYEALIGYPAVRELIDRHAKLAKKGLTGEDFLRLCDKLMPVGVPLDKLVAIAQPLYARLGIKTGKQRTATLATPPGRAIVRLLCSLARNGQTLRTVQQATDGCSFTATLPSDVWSLEGDLVATVRRHAGHCEVEVATNIPGQLYDWGKSNRCLDHLFVDLQVDPA